jgi:hypothetical protein
MLLEKGEIRLLINGLEKRFTVAEKLAWSLLNWGRPFLPEASMQSNRRTQSRLASTAPLFGSTIEWYDFFVYGTVATTIVGPMFFSKSGFNFTNTFLISCATATVSMPRSTVLDSLLIVGVVQFIGQLCAARIAEAIGDVKLLKWTAGLGMLGPYPMFMLAGTKGMFGIVLGVPRTTFAHRASTRSYAVMRLGILGLITLGQVTLTSRCESTA